MSTLWHLVNWLSQAILAVCGALILAYILGFGRAKPPEDRQEFDLKRRRLIWRAGESPWVEEAQKAHDPDTRVSGSMPVDSRASPKKHDPPSEEETQPSLSKTRRLRPRGVERGIANFYISKRLLEEFKHRCKAEGVNMSAVLESLIERWLGEAGSHG